ncbi:MAG: Phage integrase family [Ramlibacter sp.]|jgi:integrase|nr:Phage integrase family [Ramlibacter sp.]
MALMPNESPSQFAVTVPVGLPVAEGELARGLEGSDSWCLAYWLTARAEDSEHTLRAYRREAGRWLAFLAALAALRAQVPPSDNLLRQARYDDAASYVAWIQPEGAPVQPNLPEPPFSDLPVWAAAIWGVSHLRPKRTKAVLRNAMVILHGMYEELAGAMVGEPPQPAVVVNPFKPFRRKGKKRKGKGALTGQGLTPDASGVAKALSDRAWSLLWQVACEAQGDPGNPRSRRVAARRRLALAMLRATWERRSAAAELLWGDLQRSRDGTWMLQRTRKGDGPVFEAVPESLIQEIALFRNALDLPMLPCADDENGRSMYWIGGRVGAEGPISDDTFYRDIVELFKLAVERVGQLEPDKTKAAELVKEFTKAGRGPHSIRHTMATQFMSAGGEARRAQAILGHSSIAITTKVYDTKTSRELADALEEQWERSGSGTGQGSSKGDSDDDEQTA